ncbi:hypothetical protein ABPG72_021042 [Tetrahymena utriculariae]
MSSFDYGFIQQQDCESESSDFQSSVDSFCQQQEKSMNHYPSDSYNDPLMCVSYSEEDLFQQKYLCNLNLEQETKFDPFQPQYLNDHSCQQYYFLSENTTQHCIATEEPSQYYSNLNEQERLFINENPNIQDRDIYTEQLLKPLEQKKTHAESKWVCNTCGQKCSNQGAFTNHVKVIHMKKKKSDKIQVHIYNYLEQSPVSRGRAKGSKSIKKSEKSKKQYQCTCNKSFCQYGGLTNHILTVHTDNKEKIKSFFVSQKCKGRPQKNVNRNVGTKRKVGRPQKKLREPQI